MSMARRMRTSLHALRQGGIDRLLPTLLLPAALWLIVAGVVQMAASATALPGDTIMRNMQKGETVSIRDTSRLIDSRRASLAFRNNGRLRQELGIGYLSLARHYEIDSPQARGMLRVARQELRHGLADAPASPYGWMALAAAETLTHGPSKRAAEALRMSLLTGPREVAMSAYRLPLAKTLWEQLPEESRELVRLDICQLWRRQDWLIRDRFKAEENRRWICEALSDCHTPPDDGWCLQP